MRGQRQLYLQLIVTLLCTLWSTGAVHAYKLAVGQYTVSASPSDNSDIDISDTSEYEDFEPLISWIKCTGTQFGRFNSTGTDSTQHIVATSASGANVIQDHIAVGVQLGTSTDVQPASGTCHYLFLANDGIADDVAVFTYTGNGTSQTVNVSPSFAIEAIVIKASSSNPSGGAMWKATSMAVDAENRSCFFGANQCVTNGITAIGTGTFDVGDNVAVNSNGVTYRGFAVKAVPNGIASGRYQGNGTSQSPTVGFQSRWAMVKGHVSQIGRQRFRDHTSTNSSSISNEADVTDSLTALGATTLSVSNSATVNQDTSIYYWLAIGDMPSGRQRVRILP